MRLAVALLTVTFVAACGGTPTAGPVQADHALARYDDQWRQKQAVLDAEAIMQGMTRARERRDQLARSAR
jgi:hypothetical protein